MMARNGQPRVRCYALVLAFVYIYLDLSVLVNGKVYPSIQWSFQNPRFREGPFRLNVLPSSKVNIICPNVATSLATTDDKIPNEERYENFWIVDNSSYHSCNVNTNISNNKKLLTCSDPSVVYFWTLVFQSFSPDKAGVLFFPGKMYYFISTSNGFKDSLDSTSKGHCETANMKMEIYVCKGSQDVHCSEAKPTTPVIALFGGIGMNTTASTATTKKDTTVQLSSSSTPQVTPTPVNEENTPSPLGPDVGQLKQEKNEPGLSIVSMWIVLVALLGALLAISVGINFYFLRKNKVKRSKKPDYNRGDSLSPPLMPLSHV